MNVVGKVGSLITQGVYSVATPFHPFGGAVDIIVVQQQDGSFRSTPWYVQFGKFQGVLKGAEKMVRINVNEVEANFHMYLDNSGEAYFIREAEDGETNRVTKDEREGILEHSLSVDNSQCNVNKDKVENYRLQSALSDPGVLRDDYASFRPDRLERSDSDACRFYDFQDDQSYEGSMDLSSEFGSSRYDNIDAVENFVEEQGSDSEMVLVSVDGHILTAPISSSEQNTENVQLGTPQFHLGPGESNGFSERDRAFMVSENVWGSDYIDNEDASSSKADSLEASCDSNNIHADRSLPANSKLEEHAIEGQGLDSVNHLEVCQDEKVSDVQNKDEGNAACQVNKKVEDQDEKTKSNHDLQPNNEDREPVSGDHVIENEAWEEHRQFTPQNQEVKDVINQGSPCLSSDVEDASPGTKNNDKFKSCLDLTMAAVGEASESEDSSLLHEPEDAKGIEMNHIQYVKASDKAEIKYAPERMHVGAEPVASVHIGVPKVKNYDSSASASDCVTSTFSTPVSSQTVSTVHTSMEVNNFESASIEKDAVHDGEKINVKPPYESAKSNSEREFSEVESNRSEIPELHANSMSEQKPTNLSSKFEISLCRHILRPGMGLNAADEAFDAHRLSEKDFESTAISVIKNENLVIRYREKYLPWDKAAPIVLGKAAFGLELPIDPRDALPVEEEGTQKPGDIDSGSASGRRWRLWPIPFRRVKTLQHSNSNASEEVFVDSESFSQNVSIEQTPASQTGTPRSEMSSKSIHKKIVRTNIPTNEQIASLNLKEGQNDVTFSFSTRVLGLQQVEAHIYLWKWNARIVISDVDGTITKSDVLGQFMPLVGKDWTQSGVARLFSAIKENGYQLLFLSARAIVQAYLTKSFLFNLKQDGKTLPTGPVVISPDGLFPSLFREVIRRAPHEFKIACLEDIKALFPPDYNPFYAGFGNRDTDELTYRKIGIPKGKIFIINPKGEVAINHRIDVKSYTSLHTLVNDMFPPTLMVEQEDYNSWNYWKMPLPDIDD